MSAQGVMVSDPNLSPLEPLIAIQRAVEETSHFLGAASFNRLSLQA